MLNAISWQQYITAVILSSAAWYAYVGLRYYQPELSAFLKIKSTKRSVVPPVANQMTVMMGEARSEADTGLYNPEELLFSNSQPDDISDQTLPKGPADDLLAEAQVLVNAYTENNDKEEFLSLFKLLLDKYEVFADEISLPAFIKQLNKYAAEKLPFEIQAEEWPLTFAS
ncbi:hypothetical protein [Mucilaginibacter boryungensis]|uniref:Uncharacterized protein n=1 Tax=Mucilaginibacter boryungensis TaxID=768480 RepID=A0ABR9XEA3_9SPHI|nr:hypothetical protein [Mucilaginibacter boryungensis]MBE9665409.1 hypothetical protein [Mucilaginibacter boryungensis]